MSTLYYLIPRDFKIAENMGIGVGARPVSIEK
jgi:hypothetical protein